ncbi:MAG TPA: helix-turn-helix transcriptional regulator [Ramlibacter sp.]|uniref:ArsR/SmtB family transcription factor n=1 Tax=Ramlibacter sp. TaxID=1917967 RepID=UPI002D581ADC|nr:helix-turn-helix transcriptional regulator [Ramlibacter sp.]HZY19647.1 helix-turn-helix transcriptional regulator [Ramlibacter sp.]
MNTNQIARIAALVAEPARTAMLVALMDGRALTANELATAGHVTPATASRHLGLLVEAGLLRVQQQGRHRYHRLASAEVARVLEGIMQLAARTASPPVRVATGPRDAAMRLARTCYDHLAGGLAVAIAERLVDEGAVVIDEDTATVTDRAGPVLAGLGLRSEIVHAQGPGGRPACRPCLDWGERRMHLAGRLGALLCAHSLQMGWLLQKPDSRALTVTARGAVALRDWLGVERWQALTDGPPANPSGSGLPAP